MQTGCSCRKTCEHGLCKKANMAWLTPCPLKPNASNVAWLTICPLKPNATKPKIMQSHVTVCTAHWFSLGLAGCSAWGFGAGSWRNFSCDRIPASLSPNNKWNATACIQSCVGNLRVTSQGIAFLVLLLCVDVTFYFLVRLLVTGFRWKL